MRSPALFMQTRHQTYNSAIAASNVDVVGMEEVSEGANHGRVITKRANRLAARTHHYWYWCWFRNEPHFPGMPDTKAGGGGPLAEQMSTFSNTHDKHWYAGQAVLSRWPIVESAVHRLPGEDAKQRLTTDCKPPGFDGDPTCLADTVFETRAAIWARLKTGVGSVSVTAAHTSGTVAQHDDLAQWAMDQSAKDDSAFLVCDCNSLPWSKAQTALRDNGWTDTYRALHPNGGPTADQQIDASHPTVSDRIDYVFMRWPHSWLGLRTSTRFMNTPAHSTATKSGWLWPSDHWGVIDGLLPGAHSSLPHTG